MRPEKKYFVEEVGRHLAKSEYVFLTDYHRISVEEVSQLRESLAAENAEFHVVKNSILNVAAREKELPDLREHLTGPTAIVVGGDNPAGVAKILKKFFKEKEKVSVKVGVWNAWTLDSGEVDRLADLPSPEILKAQLLGVLSAPARGMVTVLAGAPRGLLNVLNAKAENN